MRQKPSSTRPLQSLSMPSQISALSDEHVGRVAVTVKLEHVVAPTVRYRRMYAGSGHGVDAMRDAYPCGSVVPALSTKTHCVVDPQGEAVPQLVRTSISRVGSPVTTIRGEPTPCMCVGEE